MNTEDLQVFAGYGVIVAIILFFAARARKGKVSSFSLLEYQRGMLYSHGLPVRELSTGTHTVWVGTEKVMWLDARPTPVSFERLTVALSHGGVAHYGYFAQAEICDFKKAIYAAQNPVHAATATMMRAVRASLHQLPGQKIQSDPEGVTALIKENIESRLANTGFRLESFRFTQLTVQNDRSAPATTEKAKEIIQ